MLAGVGRRVAALGVPVPARVAEAEGLEGEQQACIPDSRSTGFAMGARAFLEED